MTDSTLKGQPMSDGIQLNDFMIADGWYEQPGGKLIAPNGQHVLTVNSEELSTGEAHLVMRTVLQALADAFGGNSK